MGTKTKRLEILLDDATVAYLAALEAAWGVSRAEVVRRSVREAFARLEGGTSMQARAEEVLEQRLPANERPMRPEPVVEVASPAVPAMLTGRQLAQQQAQARERRRGDETDQRGGDDL